MSFVMCDGGRAEAGFIGVTYILLVIWWRCTKGQKK